MLKMAKVDVQITSRYRDFLTPLPVRVLCLELGE